MKSRLGSSDATGTGRTWRVGAGVWSIVLAGGLAAAFATPGCLNPRPEELPSNQVTPVVPGEAPPATPVRESCDDNPLLAECGPAFNGEPAPGAAAPEPAPTDSDNPIELGGDGGGDADAGVEAPSDAGAFTEASADSGTAP